MNQRISKLEQLLGQLSQMQSIADKLAFLGQQDEVKDFLSKNPWFQDLITNLSLDDTFLVKSVLALGEGPVVFYGWKHLSQAHEKLVALIEVLQTVETFYDSIGGVIGYHAAVLKLLAGSKGGEGGDEGCEKYFKPPGLDISKDSVQQRQAVLKGVDSLSVVGEIYPIGGAGDRLDLKDEAAGTPLPAAVLPFNGRSLLEGMIRDLWGKEYLYYKISGKKFRIPVALMTSVEKDNDRLIKEIMLEKGWFGRSKRDFTFFTQPLIPVITEEGHWSMKEPLQPSLKPGGHGVMWKLALDKGVFDWFAQKGVAKGLVRQINNPVAGTDDGLLAFTGFGNSEKKVFGFASCYRFIGAAEGMNVLIEKQCDERYVYAITNIEYTDFKKRGIEDVPEESHAKYSRFPANTNLLFVDLARVAKEAKRCPVPGMVINMKHMYPFTDAEGRTRQVKAGRLESTMQNIADHITDESTTRLTPDEMEAFGTFVTYNKRAKTISVTKKSFKKGLSMVETPVGCFYEQQKNHHQLLSQYCEFDMPSFCDEESYLREGPSVIFLFHPALGPLWSVIAQKICHGKIAAGSEVQIEIADVAVTNLDLDGSLLIDAERVLGSRDDNGVIQCGEDGGKCVLKDVIVRNSGIDRAAGNVYWKNEIQRVESLQINLHGNGEFVAEGVTFDGDFLIDVPDGFRVTAKMENGEVVFHREEITKPSWTWQYTIDQEDRILLIK